MNTCLLKRASTLLTVAAVAVIGSILPAKAETNDANLLQPVSEYPGTTLTSASALITEPTQPQVAQTTIPTTEPVVAQTRVVPGRATRSGPSYIGIGGNIGLSGDTSLGEGAFAVISKIGLTRNISVRPAVLFGDDAVFLVPVTVDFPSENLEVTQLNVAPYLGAGVEISTGDDSNIGILLTGGVDVPISPQITANASFNVGFLDETDLGVLIGVGYNF